MKKEELLKSIAAKAKADARKRKDPRFLNVMGFLVAKGFLGANYPLPRLPNKKLFLEDAVWAGKNLEPRILEVLPAAVLRLGAHFDYNPEKHVELAGVIKALKRGDTEGPEFYGVPYAKAKAWIDLPLADGRTKRLGEKKVPRTFRLAPAAARKLKEMAARLGCTETEFLESKILGVS
jgi:hypothetical protein